MTFRAALLVAVLFQFFAERQLGSIVLFNSRNIRRWIVWWFGNDLARHPGSSFDRVRFAAVTQPCKNSCIREHSTQVFLPMLDRDKSKPVFRLATQVVIVCHDFVGDNEIGLNQIPQRQILFDQVSQKLDRFLSQLSLRVTSQSWVSFGIDRDDVQFIETEPLRRELVDELFETRVADHAFGLGVQRRKQFVFRRKFQQTLVRCGVPQEVRQFRSKFVGIEVFRFW